MTTSTHFTNVKDLSTTFTAVQKPEEPHYTYFITVGDEDIANDGYAGVAIHHRFCERIAEHMRTNRPKDSKHMQKLLDDGKVSTWTALELSRYNLHNTAIDMQLGYIAEDNMSGGFRVYTQEGKPTEIFVCWQLNRNLKEALEAEHKARPTPNIGYNTKAGGSTFGYSIHKTRQQ